MSKVTFGSSESRLRGTLFGTAREQQAGILFIHGQGSSQKAYEHRATAAATELDAICLTFDLRGHGEDSASFGRFSIPDHLDDATFAYDYLVSHHAVAAGRIGVCGASYGGYLAGLLTARRSIKRLLLRAPSLARASDFGGTVVDRSTNFRVPTEFDSLQVLKRYAGKVLIVESAKDEVIPPLNIQAYLEVCRHGEHIVIADATHALTDPAWDHFFAQTIVNWFRNL